MANALVYGGKPPLLDTLSDAKIPDFHFAKSMHSVIKDFLKSSIDIVSLMSSVSEFQSFAASYLMDPSP